ncbi:MAG TPA: GTPase, partial [Acidimicrobiia bacterium]|nr:GTPase [Acidimicrobiia bacterium]
MFAVRELSGIADDLNRLAHALGDLSMGQHLSSQGLERDRLVRTIQHYLIPRAIDPTTPLTVVFAGPTGAGKSTLINSLTGLNVSVAGPLRPTTTNPLVLASADRVHDF